METVRRTAAASAHASAAASDAAHAVRLSAQAEVSRLRQQVVLLEHENALLHAPNAALEERVRHFEAALPALPAPVVEPVPA